VEFVTLNDETGKQIGGLGGGRHSPKELKGDSGAGEGSEGGGKASELGYDGG